MRINEAETAIIRRTRKAAAVRTLPDNGASLPAASFGIAATPRPTYREFAPPRHLRDTVVCFWQHGATEAPTTARVIPGRVRRYRLGWRSAAPCGRTDDRSGALPDRRGNGDLRRPPAARRGPPHPRGEREELLDLDVPLHDLWPRERVGRWEAAASGRDRFAAMVAAMCDRLADDGPATISGSVSRWLARSPGRPLAEIERLTGLGERQIRRRFDEAIGYGPKKLQRIFRLQRLLWLTRHATGRGLNLSGWPSPPATPTSRT